MRWHKRVRSFVLSVSTKIATCLVVGISCCLGGREADAASLNKNASTGAFLESYILRAAKKGCFNYEPNVFVNIRFDSFDISKIIDILLQYISEWYKLYSKIFNFSQTPSKNNIVIIVVDNALKDAKSGKIVGFGFDLSIINEKSDYCFVEALNENNTKFSYGEASILIDPSMGGDEKNAYWNRL